jgi:hypothetical protein
VNRRLEHPSGGQTDNVGATFHPDHWAPLTWYRCITEGCAERVDPWDHSTRCTHHRAQAVADLERIRTLVDAGRRRGGAEAHDRRYSDA